MDIPKAGVVVVVEARRDDGVGKDEMAAWRSGDGAVVIGCGRVFRDSARRGQDRR